MEVIFFGAMMIFFGLFLSNRARDMINTAGTKQHFQMGELLTPKQAHYQGLSLLVHSMGVFMIGVGFLFSTLLSIGLVGSSISGLGLILAIGGIVAMPILKNKYKPNN